MVALDIFCDALEVIKSHSSSSPSSRNCLLLLLLLILFLSMNNPIVLPSSPRIFFFLLTHFLRLFNAALSNFLDKPEVLTAIEIERATLNMWYQFD